MIVQKIYPLFFACVLACFSAGLCFSQQLAGKYRYEKRSLNGATTHVFSGPDTVEIHRKVRLTETATERRITTTNNGYKLVKDSRTHLLLSKDGNLLATFVTKGKSKYDIKLPDGKVYDRTRLSNKSWNYTLDGKEVMVCAFVKEERKRYLQYSIMDPSDPGLSDVILTSHFFATDMIQRRAYLPFWLGAVLGLAVIRELSKEPPGSEFR